MSDKLEANFDRCLFVAYPKEILDIISTKLWSKSCLFQSIQFSQRKNFFYKKIVGTRMNLVMFKC